MSPRILNGFPGKISWMWFYPSTSRLWYLGYCFQHSQNPPSKTRFYIPNIWPKSLLDGIYASKDFFSLYCLMNKIVVGRLICFPYCIHILSTWLFCIISFFWYDLRNKKKKTHSLFYYQVIRLTETHSGA